MPSRSKLGRDAGNVIAMIAAIEQRTPFLINWDSAYVFGLYGRWATLDDSHLNDQASASIMPLWETRTSPTVFHKTAWIKWLLFGFRSLFSWSWLPDYRFSTYKFRKNKPSKNWLIRINRVQKFSWRQSVGDYNSHLLIGLPKIVFIVSLGCLSVKRINFDCH